MHEKIWKTWKPRKKEKEGNQDCIFISTPRKNEGTIVLVSVFTEAAPSTAPTPDRTAAPSTYLYYIMIICLICE